MELDVHLFRASFDKIFLRVLKAKTYPVMGGGGGGDSYDSGGGFNQLESSSKNQS